MPFSRDALGFALGFAGMVLFAGTLPAARLGVAAFDPLFFTAARAVIGGLAAGLVLLLCRRPLPRGGQQWRNLLIVAVCLVLGFPIFTALALVTVPAAHAAVVLGILPLMTTASAALLIGERPSPGFWVASAIGCGLVVTFALRSGGAGALAWGDLLLLASIVVCGIGYALSGQLARTMQGWEVIAWALVVCLPAALIAAIALRPSEWSGFPASAWWGLLYVGLVSQFAGFVFWNAGLAIAGVARVGQLQLVQPFIGVALAVPINGEPIELETIGFALTVVAVVVIGRRMRVARSET